MEIDHVGSAHTDAELELLLEMAREGLHPGPGILDLGTLPRVQARTEDVADWATAGPMPMSSPGGRPQLAAGGGRLVATASLVLWDVLTEASARLGFDTVGDDVFKSLVLARIVEPTSKADTIRVLDEIGADALSLRTVFRCLQRCNKQDYRGTLAKACLAHSVRTTGTSAMVLYDVTRSTSRTRTRTRCARSG